MAHEKVARLVSATQTFYPKGEETKGIVLGHQQSITLSKSSEKKELLSNDEALGQSVREIETKITYTIKTELKDLSSEILALAFRGSVIEKTYKKGDTFITGKVIKDKTQEIKIGDLVLEDNKIYVALEDFRADTSTEEDEDEENEESTEETTNKKSKFDINKCAKNPYNATTKQINPETRGANYGKLVIEGINIDTGKRQFLSIPLVNLSFEGDLAISSDDFAGISLEGKILKDGTQALYTFVDA